MPIERTASAFALITFGLAGAAYDRRTVRPRTQARRIWVGASASASPPIGSSLASRRQSASCWQGCDDGVGMLLGTRQPGPGAETSLLLGYE